MTIKLKMNFGSIKTILNARQVLLQASLEYDHGVLKYKDSQQIELKLTDPTHLTLTETKNSRCSYSVAKNKLISKKASKYF